MFAWTINNCKQTVGLRDGAWAVATLSDDAILVGDANGGITRFAIEGGEQPSLAGAKAFPSTHTLAVVAIRLNGARTLAVSLGMDALLCVWDTLAGQLLTRHQAAVFDMLAVDMHPASNVVAVGAPYSRVLTFGASLGNPSLTTTTDHLSCAVTAVRYSCDGRWLTAGHSDGVVVVLDAVTMGRVRTLQAASVAPVRDVLCVGDNTTFALHGDGRVHFFRDEGDTQGMQPRGVLNATAIAWDGRRGVVWIAVPTGRVSVDLKGDAVTAGEPAAGVRYETLAVTPGGGRLIGGSDDKRGLVTVTTL